MRTLPPGQPDHRSHLHGPDRPEPGSASAVHVGQHEILQTQGGDRPGRVEDRRLRCGRRRSTDGRCGWPRRRAGRPAGASGSRRGPESRWCVASRSSTSPGDPDLRVDQDDDVVADAFEVGDDVRGEQHADLLLGDRLHQHLQELAPGQRVQARDRLVEHQQLGPLGQPEGQRELGPLAAGEPARLLARVEAEAVDPSSSRGVVPPWVEVGAEAQMVGDGEPGVRRGVLGDEADLGQLARSPRPVGPPHTSIVPDGRGQDAHRQAEQGRLAGAVRPDQAGHAAGRDLQGAVPQRPPAPVALAQRRGPPRRRSRDLLAHGAKGAREERLDALVVEPGQARLGRASGPGRGVAARARPARSRRGCG